MAALRFDATENGSSARARTMTAAANLLRATVNNRVDNEVLGASVAMHSAADRTAPEPFTHCRFSRREQSLRPSHTAVAY